MPGRLGHPEPERVGDAAVSVKGDAHGDISTSYTRIDQQIVMPPPVPAAARSPEAIAAHLPLWGMAWPRNPSFTGRAEELSVLRARLVGDGAVAVVPQALHGLGGVGKTQLAVEYAYRHREDYDLVWWVSADQPGDLAAGLARLAGRLGLSSEGETSEAATAVVEVLGDGRAVPRWLVVVDNADAPSDLHGLRAVANTTGHVLITSRHPGWGSPAGAIEVDVFPRADSIELLRGRAPRLTEMDASRIANLLGDLPLAVEQAGIWLGQTTMTADDYCRLVEEQIRGILVEGKPENYPVPVAATWTVTLDQIDDPAAVSLLCLWSFFGPAPIPAELTVPAYSQLLPPSLTKIAEDPIRLARVVSVVHSLGLVKNDSRGIVIHRLVQAVFRDYTPSYERGSTRDSVHRLLATAASFNPIDPKNWSIYDRIRPHALATGLMSSGRPECKDLMNNIVRYLGFVGDFSSARSLGEDLFNYRVESLGEEDSDTVIAAIILSVILLVSEDYAAARELKGWVVDRLEKLFGKGSPTVLSYMQSLANFQSSTGDFVGARGLLEGVLNRRRETLGQGHPDTLDGAVRLAGDLQTAGDFVGARGLLEGVLNRRRETLGEAHPDTLDGAVRLAGALQAAGDFIGAQELLNETLDLIPAVNNFLIIRVSIALANLRCITKDYSGARRLIEEILDRARSNLGENHSLTRGVEASLAEILRASGDRMGSRRILERVLIKCRKSLGEDHVETMVAAVALAGAMGLIGDNVGAQRLLGQLFDRRRDVLGADLMVTLRTAIDLASKVGKRGDVAGLEELLEWVLNFSRVVLGEMHLVTRDVAEALSELRSRRESVGIYSVNKSHKELNS